MFLSVMSKLLKYFNNDLVFIGEEQNDYVKRGLE